MDMVLCLLQKSPHSAHSSMPCQVSRIGAVIVLPEASGFHIYECDKRYAINLPFIHLGMAYTVQACTTHKNGDLGNELFYWVYHGLSH